MTIETKFNIGDKVYYTGKIIDIPLDDSGDKTVSMYEGPYKSPYYITKIKLAVFHNGVIGTSYYAETMLGNTAIGDENRFHSTFEDAQRYVEEENKKLAMND